MRHIARHKTVTAVHCGNVVCSWRRKSSVADRLQECIRPNRFFVTFVESDPMFVFLTVLIEKFSICISAKKRYTYP